MSEPTNKIIPLTNFAITASGNIPVARVNGEVHSWSDGRTEVHLIGEDGGLIEIDVSEPLFHAVMQPVAAQQMSRAREEGEEARAATRAYTEAHSLDNAQVEGAPSETAS